MDSVGNGIKQYIQDNIYTDYKKSLLNGERGLCSDVISNLVETETPIMSIYLELFQKSLYEVGELWESNKITVAHEHIATAITEGLMNILYPKIFSQEHNGKSILVTCVPEEYHQIGAKMVADSFEMNHWDSHFLGANTPTSDLIAFIQDKKPDLVAVSLSIYFNVNNLKKVLNTIKGNFRNQDVIIGGQAFRWGGFEIVNDYKNIEFITDIRNLETIF